MSTALALSIGYAFGVLFWGVVYGLVWWFHRQGK